MENDITQKWLAWTLSWAEQNRAEQSHSAQSWSYTKQNAQRFSQFEASNKLKDQLIKEEQI